MPIRLVLFVILLSYFSAAQPIRTDSIYVLKSHYYQNGIRLKKNNLNNLLASNMYSKAFFNKASFTKGYVNIFGGLSGIFLGVFVAQLANKPNYTFLIVGSISALITVPYYLKYKQFKRESIIRFNRNSAIRSTN